MRSLLTGLLTSTAVWAAPDDKGSTTTVAPLDLTQFDAIMENGNLSSQSVDSFEEIDQEGAGAEILERHQTRTHIDADDDETSTSVKMDDGGQVEDKPPLAGEDKKPDPAKTEPEKPAATEQAGAEDETKLQPWVVERINREKRKTARLQGELDAIRQAPKAEAAPTQAEPPKAEDFKDFEEYMEAKTLHDRSTKNAKPAAPPNPQAEAVRVQLGGVVAEINAVLQDHPELHKIVNDPTNPKGLKINADMILAIGETKDPAAVLQAFADNPAMSVEISKLTPVQIAARILALDKPGAAAPKPQKQQEPGKRLSNAPEPIAPLNGQNQPTVSMEEADFSTFEQQRALQEQTKERWGW